MEEKPMPFFTPSHSRETLENLELPTKGEAPETVDMSHLQPKPEDAICAHCGWHWGRHLDVGIAVPWLWCPKTDGTLPDVTVNNDGPTRIVTPVAPHGVWKSRSV